ncbi:MAG: flagellin [Bordetella sp. SCN 67-23]|nr:flagellin [Burkholderiales bacterium]ODS73374.1 MAG: flagellin [Bordetella sp. SCN 67-23]ODU76298.1 MAG: flagellin [Bordetella sp. SCN 68-11]OJW88344.1 MAG: flagellin [Burkholderiales bacterium 67-32]
MAQVINTNIASLNAQRNLNSSQSAVNTALQRLSTGLRINSAKDDAAGLAISERMSTQINGLNQAVRNANDGISLAQTAEGALSQIGTNLQRIRTLAVQSSNSTNSADDRASLQKEVAELTAEIDRVARDTDFNGTKLLDGSFASQKFQVGANAGQTITISNIADAKASTLGRYNGFNATNLSIGTASDTAAAQSVTIGSAGTFALGSIANDAKAIANAMNTQGIAGLNVTANATEVAGTSTVTTTTAGTASFTLNGLTINLTATTNAATNRENALTAINAQSATTGVRATDTGSGLKLEAADGRNVTIGALTLGTAVATTLSDFGLAAAGTTGASLNVSYKAPTGVTGSISSTGAFALAGTITQTGTALNAIDISTVAGASNALSALDAALSTVSDARASLGAIQNRFTSVVSSLETTSENLSSSRSRIQDADFASETASLTRGQILQQAGTAMLAQANSLPNNVLTLLRG